MGTSTPLLNPRDRFLAPLKIVDLDEVCKLFIGGAGNGLALIAGHEGLLINTNLEKTAEDIYHALKFKNITVKKIINTKCHFCFSGGNYLYPEAKDIYIGEYTRAHLIDQLGDKQLPKHILREAADLHFFDEIVQMIPVPLSFFAGNLLVFLKKRNILLMGDLFFNGLFPYLPAGVTLSQVAEWAKFCEKLAAEFSTARILPAEGAVGSSEDLLGFAKYLTELAQGAPLARLTQQYLWKDIPGISSIEKNLEVFRKD